MSDDARTAEQQVGAAIEKLREDMPKQFVLLYVKGDVVEGEEADVQIVSHCNLKAAQTMLDTGIKALSEQYAYDRAREKVAK